MNQHQHITMSMFPPQPLSMIWLGSPCHAFTTMLMHGLMYIGSSCPKCRGYGYSAPKSLIHRASWISVRPPLHVVMQRLHIRPNIDSSAFDFSLQRNRAKPVHAFWCCTGSWDPILCTLVDCNEAKPVHLHGARCSALCRINRTYDWCGCERTLCSKKPEICLNDLANQTAGHHGVKENWKKTQASWDSNPWWLQPCNVSAMKCWTDIPVCSPCWFKYKWMQGCSKHDA